MSNAGLSLTEGKINPNNITVSHLSQFKQFHNIKKWLTKAQFAQAKKNDFLFSKTYKISHLSRSNL